MVVSGIQIDMICMLLALILSLGPPALAGDCASPEDCGLAETIIPDFTLTNLNTRSSTYGAEVSRDDLLGQVLLIYWAQAT